LKRGPELRIIEDFVLPLIILLSLLGKPSFADTTPLIRFETNLLLFDVSGNQLSNVEIVDDYSGHPAIELSFSPTIWGRLAAFTKTAEGGTMTILVCGRAVSTPSVSHAVDRGIFVLSGGDIDYAALEIVLERRDCNAVPLS
jgi:hypothetical protein